MTPQSVLTACCLILIGAGLYLSPDSVTSRVRMTANDLLRPGFEASHRVKESLAQSVHFGKDNSADVAQLEEALAIAEERNHALQIRLAQETEQRRQEQAISPEIVRSQRLILPTLIDVAVLGDTIAEDWCAGKLIDHGETAGLREKELVISTRKSQKTLIDVGEDHRVSTEDTLLLGRCVIGKVEHVGRWTSTIQLVTNANYSGRAQLIRETPEGFVYDATEGILRGQGGPLCRLEGIPASNSVHVHDAVYTRERDGIMNTPLYYGEVVEATLDQNDREWTVLVKPAPLPTQLTRVQVLRMAANTERLAWK